MFWEALTLVLTVALCFFIYQKYQNEKEGYEHGDAIEAAKALEQLHSQLAEGKEPSAICDVDFHKLAKNIYMAKISLKEMQDQKEGYYPSEEKSDTKTRTPVPKYPDYSFPSYPPGTLKALYYSGLPIGKLYSSLPPYLYNRMFYWYPGFQTSGWSWWIRPGMQTGFQSYWIKNNGNYFYIQNG